jgi:hypothetical protein
VLPVTDRIAAAPSGPGSAAAGPSSARAGRFRISLQTSLAICSSRSLLLGGVLVVALALRLWGITWQLPDALYQDEMKYVQRAWDSLQEAEDRAVDFRNPWLFRHAMELEYRLLALPGQTEPGGTPGTDRSLLGPRILLARLTVALLGFGSVALLYAVGRRMLGPAAGLLAAALLAVNLLHVQLSHLGINDVPAGFFMVAALLPAAELLERPNARGFLLAGLLGGLAAATKYNFGIVLAVPLVVCALQVLQLRQPRSFPPEPDRKEAGGWRACPPVGTRRLILVGPLLLGLGALVGFVIGMPEAIWSFPDVRDGMIRQAELGARRWPGQAPDPVLLLYGTTLVQAFGPAGPLAAAAGLAFLFGRQPGLGLALAVSPLAYLAVMGGKALFFARFALPLVPFVCLFAAYGLVRLWSLVRTARPRAAIATIGCLMVLGPPAFLSARLDRLAGQPDTRVEARQWVLANIPRGTRIAAQTFTLPLGREGDELEGYRLSQFDTLTEEQLNRLVCAGHHFVLVSSYRSDPIRTAGRSGEAAAYEALAKRGQLVATVWPGPNDTSLPLSIDNAGLPFWQVERYARPGPSIRVYAVPPSNC